MDNYYWQFLILTLSPDRMLKGNTLFEPFLCELLSLRSNMNLITAHIIAIRRYFPYIIMRKCDIIKSSRTVVLSTFISWLDPAHRVKQIKCYSRGKKLSNSREGITHLCKQAINSRAMINLWIWVIISWAQIIISKEGINYLKKTRNLLTLVNKSQLESVDTCWITDRPPLRLL